MTRRGVLFVAGIFFAAACRDTRQAPSQETAGVSVYALKYGESDYPARLVNTAEKTEKVRMGWLAYLIEERADGVRRLTLVDCGFSDKNLVARFGLRNFRPVWRLIADLGYKPEDIDRIFLTHTHFDHALDVDRFPQAVVYAGGDEILKPAEPGLVPVFAKLKRENRLHGVDGRMQLEKGMELLSVRGHTRGSLVVRFTHNNPATYFTGDECYFAKSCREKIPLPAAAAFNPTNNRTFIESLEKDAIIRAGHELNPAPGRWITPQVFLFSAGG